MPHSLYTHTNPLLALYTYSQTHPFYTHTHWYNTCTWYMYLGSPHTHTHTSRFIPTHKHIHSHTPTHPPPTEEDDEEDDEEEAEPGFENMVDRGTKSFLNVYAMDCWYRDSRAYLYIATDTQYNIVMCICNVCRYLVRTESGRYKCKWSMCINFRLSCWCVIMM